MVEKSPKFLWGAIAFAIYFTLLGLLIFYFNTRSEDKSKHYVKKDEHRIQVALTNPKKEKISKRKSKPKVKPTPSKVKPKPKPKTKTKTKTKKEPKVKPKVKDTKKKVIKEKLVKKRIKKRDENITKAKRIKKPKTKKKKENKAKIKPEKKKKTIDLFSEVKPKKTKLNMKVSTKPIKTEVKNNIIKVTDAPPSASERISNSLKNQKNKESGVENAYIAKVESILENWPAQSEFAGEKATVTFFIKPTGKFEFQVTSGSNNDTFNVALLGFLRQLQGIGFGKHSAGRTYEFEAEFIAKE